MPDIRKDALSNTWVIIAPERASRPQAKKKKKADPPMPHCPFCEGEDAKSEIVPYATCAATFDEQGNWVTRILNNKFPALKTSEQYKEQDFEHIYHQMTGVGGHEILIESPEHKHFKWATMPKKQLITVFKNYQCRYAYWRKDSRIAYLSIFRNHGKIAGASVKHPHSQMIATPLVPPRVETEMKEMKKHKQKTNKCLMCHMIKFEKKARERIIMENDDFVAFSNFAPRFPYETLVVPKKHRDTFEDISEKEMASLAEFMSTLMAKFDKLLDDPPFNLIFHVSPIRMRGIDFFHWHIEIIFRLSQPAGFEWGSGIYINSVPPEKAAEELRKV